MPTPKQIDDENEEFYKEYVQKVEIGKISLKDIVGFDLKSPRVYIPTVPCSATALSDPDCSQVTARINNLIFSLTPLYDTLLYPISHVYEYEKLVTDKTFEILNSISLNDFMKFVERGKIIPYFEAPFSEYDPKFIERFLEPGLPRISVERNLMLYLYNRCKDTDHNCKLCNSYINIAKKDLKKSNLNLEKYEIEYLCAPMGYLYSLGIKKERVLNADDPANLIKSTFDIVAANNIQATIETNCPTAKEALGLFSADQTKENFYDTIVTGLGVKYSSNIDLDNYLDIMNEKTTRAMREIVDQIRKDPYAKKYSENLNGKLVEYNHEIEEISRSRSAKIYNAISDIAVYGSGKIIEKKTNDVVKIGSSNLQKISDWLGSRMMDTETFIKRGDLTIAQLYRTKYKIDECTKQIKNE